MGWKSRMDEEKGRKEERDGKAKGRGGRSGWSRSKWNEEGKRKRERERGMESVERRLQSVVTLNYKCNGFSFRRFLFRAAYLATRIRACGKKRSRGGPAGWGGRLERFERRFCDSCSRLPVRRLVSTHRVKRWSTANARRQHIPVLPNGPPRTSSLLWIVVSRVARPSIETCTLFQR